MNKEKYARASSVMMAVKQSKQTKKANANHHANQKNPNNYTKQLSVDNRANQKNPNQHVVRNRANQLNPEHEQWWKSRGFEIFDDDNEEAFAVVSKKGNGYVPYNGQGLK